MHFHKKGRMSEKQSNPPVQNTQDYVPGFPKKTIIVFFVLCLGMSFAGYRYYLSEKDRYTREKSKELSAIVSLKKGQFENWRNERLSDANFIFRNDAIVREARAVVTHVHVHGGASADTVPEWMKSMYRNQHYGIIALFDRTHRQVLAFPDRRIDGTPAFDSLLDRASRGKNVFFSDFYRDAHSAAALSIVIPLLVRTPSAAECVGIVVLQIDPATTLYPLLQSWPIPSVSGELLLLRNAGGSVTYLNNLRFRQGAAVAFTESLSDTSLLVTRAFITRDSLLDGTDYRQMQTIGVSRPIAGTAWTLVAKSDAEEIYAPLRQTEFFLRVIIFLIALTGGISIVSVWRHRRGLFYRRNYLQEIERKHAESALHESEERFRMLVESLNEIVYTLDPAHHLVNLYGSWVERAGLNAGTLIGKTVEELFGSEGYEYQRQMEDRALQGEHVLYESTYIDRMTKAVHDIQTSLSPLRDSTEMIIGIVGIGRDITKMKRLERDLLQSQKMDSLGKLAGGIAHDFNNLLAMLMGSAELLKRNLRNDAVNSTYVQRILEATERGSSIAKRLLMFSRQGEVQFQPVSVSHILNEVSEMLRYTFPKTIEVIVNIQVDDGIVNGDAGHLHQAFVNLCLNAKDAMGDQGTLTLTERIVDAKELREKHQTAPAGKYVSVSISDTGAGIEPGLRGRIFEPFFTTKETGKGTGLGLSIVDGIIRSHDGFIDVQSEPGQGTTFTLYLPASAAPMEQREPQEHELLGKGERILVVDDETLIRDLLGEYLHESGYAVLLAADADEALAIYEKQGSTIDIVITDLGMPKMSGEELFNRLHRIDPSLAVIISSGYLDGTTRNELLAKGVADVVTKPYRLKEIQKILYHHLRKDITRI
jgi:PAS domain S-box-containing protein